MKNDKQCVGWMLTIPAEKITFEELEKLMNKFHWIGQLELSESGYLHYQLYLETKNRNGIRFSTLKNHFPSFIHFEPRRGTRAQAISYVTKKDTKQGEVLGNAKAFNYESKQGKRTDLETYVDFIKDGKSVAEIVFEFPNALRYERHLNSFFKKYREREFRNQGIQRQIKVFYVYGKTRVGKTYGVLSSFSPYDVYRVSDYYRGPYDGYNGEKVLVYDEFSGQLPIEEILNLTDGYLTSLPARYENKFAEFETVIFLSNLSPDEVYKKAPKAQKQAFLARFNGGIFEQVGRAEFIDVEGQTNPAPYLT